MDHFKLDRSQLAEGALASLTVVVPFDPSRDLRAQLVAIFPRLAVEQILPQEREERLHRRVVTGGGDPAHRSAQAMPAQCLGVGPASKLTTPIAVDHTSCNVASTADRVLQSSNGEVAGHPWSHRIADDAVAEHVLDRAQVELALTGGMLGDVGQPQLVRSIGSEMALH